MVANAYPGEELTKADLVTGRPAQERRDVNLGDGFSRRQWDALNELARRDGFRLECVAYSGVPDHQLLPILPPLDARPPGRPEQLALPRVRSADGASEQGRLEVHACPYTQWILGDCDWGPDMPHLRQFGG